MGVVAYSPLQNGLLTGKFSQELLQSLPDDDFRKRHNPNSFFGEPLFSKILTFVDRLRPIAKGYDKAIAQLAIAWVLMNPAITSAIVGARKPGQAEQNSGGAGWQISAADMENIEEVYRETVGF